MNFASIRAKQIIYGSLILVIFAAMVPYTAKLEEAKSERDLGEATLGQVDAGSFMLKLALLGGMRGIVANALWMRAQDLQRMQEWDKLDATVSFITKLQPHFLSIWTFQGWNLAYNVSVEWDDPADKYEWIKRGIKHLKSGVDNNPTSSDLAWNTAWTYYHKYGFADEAIVLRREFYDDEDDDFKSNRSPDPASGRRRGQVFDDSFQVAHGWFLEAVEKADRDNERLESGGGGMEANAELVDPIVNRRGRPGDLAFRSMPAHAQTRYASGLEKQSIQGLKATFGEKARNEWQKALDEWRSPLFGRHQFWSHNAEIVQGEYVKVPVIIDDVMDLDRIDRMAEDPSYWTDVIDVPGLTPTLEEAEKLARNRRYWTNRWSDQMNYRYWVERSTAEREPEGVEARQLFYEGTVAYLEADFLEAVEKFRQGLELWETVLKRYPTYRDDDLNMKDTGMIVRRYTDSLRQAGMEEPEDTPFLDLVRTADFEPSLDPFDELDMLGPTGTGQSRDR